MRKTESFIICSLPLLLLQSTCVDAGIFLKAKDPVIVQDAAWLHSNSIAITSVAPDVPANKFSKAISPLNNVPSAPKDGAIGILYNRDNSCSSSTVQQPIPIPFYAADPKSTKVPKIALIKKQGGHCSLVDKIKHAEAEGAIGTVVYDTIPDQDPKTEIPAGSGIKIPAYYVDHDIGVALYHQLEQMAGIPIAAITTNDGVRLAARISVRVSLFPAENVKSAPWELTLLVMIVIFGTSAIFSVAMHIYMWKKGQRLLREVERHRAPGQQQAENLPMGKTLLTVARLCEFPTRMVYSLPDEEERIKMETVLSDEKQLEALINTTSLPNSKSTDRNSKLFFSRKKLLMRKPSMTSVAIKIDAPINSMCVVCLEAFKIGDEVRQLPCLHEYHCICIDPWLTSKSGECPLCKFDCSSDNKSEKTVADPDGLIAAASVLGLRGMLLRPYLRFKANRRRRIGQVGNLPNSTQQPQQQYSRQSTMITSTEGSPSFGSLAAMRAIEDIENVNNLNHRISITEAVAAAATCSEEEEEGNRVSVARTPTTTTVLTQTRIVMPQDEVFADEHPRASSTIERESVLAMHDEAQRRLSNVTQGYASTITTSNSTYAPASDGGRLPDTDTSSISLCSIDLSSITEEFQFPSSFSHK